LPCKIGDFTFKNINKIDEFVNHFHNVNLKYVEKIKGFDPNKIFVEHMLSVGFNNSFIHTILSEEEDNNLGAPAHNDGDLETLLSTNNFTRKKERVLVRRAPQSPVVTPKNTKSWSNAPTTHPTRKFTNNISSSGGENNPPSSRKIESSHKLPLKKKRKNVVQEEGDHRIENDINNFSLEDMELEADIEKMFPTIDQPGNMAHQNSSLIIENETFNEEESFTFQSGVFDKESKKLIIEKSDMKNKKGESRSEVDLKDMCSSQISRIHREIEDALDDSIGGLEAENTKFKERIKELEDALMNLPLLSSPLSIVRPTTPIVKLKGSSSLLTSERIYVETNIKKKMALIIEAWEVLKSIVSFGSRAHSFHEYFQVDLKN
jgi:hypothetical protein